jgi:NAD+ kinase
MIGVVGAGGPTERVTAAFDGVGLDAVETAADSAGAEAFDVLAAIGEAALIDLVTADVETPVLPIGPLDGLPSVDPDAAVEAVEEFLDDRERTRRNPLLTVDVGDAPAGTAIFDVMLVRSEPGRISEYSLTAGAARSRFRADGVVAATPAGSHGYPSAVGGPRLEPDTEAVAVVPVAAFGLGAPTWVLDPTEGLELRVERDEGDVSLLVDGRERERLSGRSTVVLRPGGTLVTIRPPTQRAAGR